MGLIFLIPIIYEEAFMQAVRINPLVYAGALIISALSVYPYFRNIKFNDFSKNWLNNDYGKNLLSSTQEYSVFMTEGGDNQVFGSLYFTYAVRLRQDLFPYDQKGNIFKRIYGDMRYVTADVVDARMELVDRGLFNGQEPFYDAIRTDAPPHLIPYAQGKPSTFLTWRRPGQNTLGDFYYKPYGIMFKVQPIRYAMMDMLSVVKTASQTALGERAARDLGRPVSPQEVSRWIEELAQEGLASRQGANVNFIKDYPKPFVRDPRETFITRWEGISNLASYDYLSREIVIGYVYDSLIYWGDQIKNWEVLAANDKDSAVRAALKKDIDNAWAEIDKLTELGKYVGHDSPSILHNMGILYLSYEKDYTSRKKELLPEAISLWERGIEQFPYGWGTYNVLFWACTQAMERYPQDAQKYMDIFDKRLSQMTNAMKHWNSMKKDVTKAEPYRQVEGYIQLRKNFNPNAKAQFEQEEKTFTAMMSGVNPNLAEAQAFIQKAINRQAITGSEELRNRISMHWNKVWQRYKNNPAYLNWHLQLLHEAVDYPDILNNDLYDTVLKEAYGLVPAPAKEDIHFNALILLARIAEKTGDTALKNRCVTRLYKDAYATRPQDYAQLVQRFESIVGKPQ